MALCVLGESGVQSLGKGLSGGSKSTWAPLASWLVCGAEKCVSGESEVWHGVYPSLWTEACLH